MSPGIAKGMCHMHHKRYIRHGDPSVRLTNLPGTLCSVDGCGKEARAKGMCATHSQRLRTRGTLEPMYYPKDNKGIFDKYVEKSQDGHWYWGAKENRARSTHCFKLEGESITRTPRRWVWAYINGIDGLPSLLTTSCGGTLCVNPEHACEFDRSNHIKSVNASNKGRRKQFCKRGHPLTPDNVYYYTYGSRLSRQCKLCKKYCDKKRNKR